MRKIRKVITEDANSLKEILEYMDCAIILHNILVSLKDTDNDDYKEWHKDEDELTRIDDPNRGDPDEEISPEEEALNTPLAEDSPKDLRRSQLADYLWEHYPPEIVRERSDGIFFDEENISDVSDDEDAEMNDA